MIAEALGEQGGKGLCDGGCDVCSGCAGAATSIDATRHAITLVRCAPGAAVVTLLVRVWMSSRTDKNAGAH